MGSAYRVLGLIAFLLIASGCVTDQQYNKAIQNVENAWKQVNDQTLIKEGRRSFKATKEQGFLAAQLTASQIGMVVEEQSYDTGFLFVTAPAPTPLTMSDWAEVQEVDTEELRSIISDEFGMLKLWVTLEPSSKEVLANIFVSENDAGIDVSVGLRLRSTGAKSDRKRRLQPPPTAVRLGLRKFWDAYETELAAVLAKGGTSAKETVATFSAGTVAGSVKIATPATRPSVDNPDAVAVIIGNKNYGDCCPSVDFAHNDAEAMKRFFVDFFGVSPGNIIDLRDLKLADMEAVFGNARTFKGKLWRWVRPRESDVFVFYSGHGVPGFKDGREYLLPVGANPETPEIYGYPVELLYGNLARLEARSMTVFLEACFSGESPGGTLIREVSGIRVVPEKVTSVPFTVMTAARQDQVASWDKEAQHGLFTKHLLDALYGAADAKRYGSPDSRITLKEIKRYLDREMTYAARRQFGRDQQAVIYGDPDKVIIDLGK